MKQNIQDGIAMAMVFAGVLLVMAVEGGAKAGGVSGAMMCRSRRRGWWVEPRTR